MSADPVPVDPTSVELDEVRALVAPIASDLRLDLYDVERRGGTIRVTLDTPPGSPSGITLDTLSLATRQISRELDHADPIAGRYTLEVTSPGLERALRTPAHFQREVGKEIALRLRDVDADERRVRGTLTAADDRSITVQLAADDHADPGDEADHGGRDGHGDGSGTDGEGAVRVIPLDAIDKARTVFEWGPQPKPGGKNGKRKKQSTRASAAGAASHTPQEGQGQDRRETQGS